jgi:arginine repressor
MPRGKKSNGPSKSQLIRDFIKENPSASAAAVVAALAEKGIKVTAGLVYMNKGRVKQAKVHRKRKMKRAAKVVSKARVSDPVALIRKVKEVVQEAGGIENLKELLAILGE